MHRSRGQSAGPRDADEMCVSRVGWKRPDRLWKTRPNQPRKVHIRGSEKNELWDRRMCRNEFALTHTARKWFDRFRQNRPKRDSDPLVSRVLWIGIPHSKSLVGRHFAHPGSEGYPGDARGNDLIKSARVESRCRRGRRSSRGKFPERFRGRRGRPRCRGLG